MSSSSSSPPPEKVIVSVNSPSIEEVPSSHTFSLSSKTTDSSSDGISGSVRKNNNNGNPVLKQQQQSPLHHQLSPTNMTITSTTTTTPIPSPSAATQECDYDINPTILYQAIEAKQWEYAISMFLPKTNKKNKSKKMGSKTTSSKKQQIDEDEIPEAEKPESSTWVVRKERNGKLRWRLLPLHAAIIFGSPLKLVELLIADYPQAVQSKDDQGMLPLHLAFRNESNWEIIDELLTAYPTAVFVSDRKGRTPLQCGIRHVNHTGSGSSVATSRPGSGSNNSVAGTNNNNAGTSNPATTSSTNPATIVDTTKTFRAVVSVLDLYSQIAVSGERKRAEQEARSLANTSIAQLKDTHLKTLAALKREWEIQQTDQKLQIKSLQEENRRLKQNAQSLEQDLSEKQSSQQSIEEKLSKMNLALREANERLKENNPSMHKLQHSNQTLRTINENLLEQQRIYHNQVTKLFHHYKQLEQERDTIRSVLLKNETTKSDDDDDDDGRSTLQTFQQWFQEMDQKLVQKEQSLNEEKKTDDTYITSDVIQSSRLTPATKESIAKS